MCLHAGPIKQNSRCKLPLAVLRFLVSIAEFHCISRCIGPNQGSTFRAKSTKRQSSKNEIPNSYQLACSAILSMEALTSPLTSRLELRLMDEADEPRLPPLPTLDAEFPRFLRASSRILRASSTRLDDALGFDAPPVGAVRGLTPPLFFIAACIAAIRPVGGLLGGGVPVLFAGGGLLAGWPAGDTRALVGGGGCSGEGSRAWLVGLAAVGRSAPRGRIALSNSSLSMTPSPLMSMSSKERRPRCGPVDGGALASDEAPARPSDEAPARPSNDPNAI